MKRKTPSLFIYLSSCTPQRTTAADSLLQKGDVKTQGGWCIDLSWKQYIWKMIKHFNRKGCSRRSTNKNQKCYLTFNFKTFNQNHLVFLSFEGSRGQAQLCPRSSDLGQEEFTHEPTQYLWRPAARHHYTLSAESLHQFRYLDIWASVWSCVLWPGRKGRNLYNASKTEKEIKIQMLALGSLPQA